MKTKTLFSILLFIILSCDQSLFAQSNIAGVNFNNPIVIGSYSSEFAYEHQDDASLFRKNTHEGVELYYQFTLQKAMNVYFRQCNPDENNLIKIYFGVLDSNMQLVAMSPFDGPSLRIEAGKYLIKVWGKHPLDRLHLLVDGYTDYALDASASLIQRNFIEMIIPTKEMTTIDQADNENSQKIIQYFDGFGRLQEEVNAAFTPKKLDLATYQEYDDYGRIIRKWLPAVSAKNGKFLKLDSIRLSSFLTNGDYMPYQKFAYEDSPLGRVKQSWGAGKMWYDNMKSINVSYATNNDIDGDPLRCAQYIIVRDSCNISLGKTGYYSTFQPNTQRFIQYHLHVEQKVDEDGNEIFNFKDWNDRLLLVRQIIDSKFCDTYYVYDEFDNLCYVLPPIASDSLASIKTWKDNDAILAKYAYLYKYDKRQRCIAKKLPGKDWEYYVYDRAGRMIFSQDGEDREKREWKFCLYDGEGRNVLTGRCRNELNHNLDPLKNIILTAKRTNTTNYLKGYMVSDIELISPNISSVVYYDNYQFIGKNEFDSIKLFICEDNPKYGQAYTASNKGLVTGMLSYVEKEDSSSVGLCQVLYYDERGRLVQQKTTNHLGGHENRFLKYDFKSNLVQASRVSTLEKVSLKEEYIYSYDHIGRLLTTRCRLNDGNEITLVDNEYDDLGRLCVDKYNGDLKTRYKYNVRSWITSIDSPVFSQELHYADGTNAAYYNGNISRMAWQNGSDSIKRSYKFTYDALNRLKDAIYNEENLISSSLNRFTEQVTGYDKQGNILGLKRYGQTSTSEYGLVDDLALTYDGNHLKTVTDRAVKSEYSNGFEFCDGANETVEYIYDKNGNLTKDLNKKNMEIKYNSLNLPYQIEFEDGSVILNIYTSDGMRVRTIHKIGEVTTTTDYCSNIIYKNGIAKLLLTDGGYFTLDDEEYHYFIQDHQGNNRVVINQNGVVEEVNNYYPFGGTFASFKDVQSYKFNGKELDTSNGLNWYDYGARQYDATIGRWNASDPISEKYYGVSPYAYCANNPIKYIDPDGKQPRPVRRGYRNGGRPNPYAFYVREMKPQSYVQATNFSYNGNGLVETVGMSSQGFLQEVYTPGGNKVQMSRGNKEGMSLSGKIDLLDQYKGFKDKLFSIETVVQYGEDGVIRKSTDMVITDQKIALQQAEYERSARELENQLGNLDFTGKSLKEIIEISAERKGVIQQKLGLSPKEKLWINFFSNPKSFDPGESIRTIIPEFKQK